MDDRVIDYEGILAIYVVVTMYLYMAPVVYRRKPIGMKLAQI